MRKRVAEHSKSPAGDYACFSKMYTEKGFCWSNYEQLNNFMDKNKTIVWVVVLVLVGSGAFYGGMKYAQNSASATRGARAGAFTAGQTGSFTGRGGVTGGARGGFVSGQVVSKDSGSITIKLQSGSSQVVLLGSSTPISKSVSGSVSDIAVGSEVLITGTTNSDGSETAQSIQIRPAVQTQSGQ